MTEEEAGRLYAVMVEMTPRLAADAGLTVAEYVRAVRPQVVVAAGLAMDRAAATGVGSGVATFLALLDELEGEGR